VNYIKDRAKEKSTIAGIAVILSMLGGVFGFSIESEAVTAVSAAIGGVVGAVEVLRREK
jgi:hypothetical protein